MHSEKRTTMLNAVLIQLSSKQLNMFSGLKTNTGLKSNISVSIIWLVTLHKYSSTDTACFCVESASQS